MSKLITSIILFLTFSTSCLADIYTSQIEGDWNDPNVWLPSGVPGPGDHVQIYHIITIPSGQVQQCSTVSIVQNTSVLNIAAMGALDADVFTIGAGGTCYLDGTLTVNSEMTTSGELYLNGVLQGDANKLIDLSGIFHWNDGTMSGDTLIVGPAASILFESPSTAHTNNAVIINNGLISWDSGSMDGNGSLDNHGEIVFGSGLTIHIDGQHFSNYNLIQKTVPSGALYFGDGSGFFNNEGTFDVTQMTLNPMASVLVYFDQDGTHTGIFETDGTAEFQFAGGSHVFSGAAGFAGMGEVTLSGANILIDMSGGFDFGNYVVNMTAGTLNKANNFSHIQFHEDFNWSGGAIGTSATTNGDLEIDSDKYCNISGNVFLGTTISTEGFVSWTGGDIKPISNLMDGTLLPGRINCYDHFYINVATDVNMIDITVFCDLVTKSGDGKVIFRGSSGDFEAISDVQINDGEWEFSCNAEIAGTITISATGTLRIGGHVGETDFVYAGAMITNNHLIASSNGYKIHFDGGTAQLLAGDGTIEKVIFRNTFGVTITGSQTISATGSIEIPDERLVVDGGNLIVYGTMMIEDCGGLPCYIRTINGGHLRMKLDNVTPTTFPVGTMNSYNPAVIKDNTPVGNNDYSISVGEDITDYSITDNIVLREWDIVRHELSAHADISLFWSPGAAEEGNTFDRNLCHIRHYKASTTSWEDLSPNATAQVSGSLYFRSKLDVSDFSPFIVSGEPSLLPIELLYLTGKVENHDALLAWATATEIQNKGFEIEKSSDAITFETIGFVAGKGTSTTDQYYSFADSSFEGEAYYRLRQVDENGHYEYTEIIFLSDKAGSFGIKIYPNPATDFVYLQPASAIYSPVSFRIVSTAGKEFLSGSFSSLLHRIDTRNLPQGIYMLECQEENNISYSKIIINR